MIHINALLVCPNLNLYMVRLTQVWKKHFAQCVNHRNKDENRAMRAVKEL